MHLYCGRKGGYVYNQSPAVTHMNLTFLSQLLGDLFKSIHILLRKSRSENMNSSLDDGNKTHSRISIYVSNGVL
jgi:hypothetical protein